MVDFFHDGMNVHTREGRDVMCIDRGGEHEKSMG
jgi:hypothetical protein